MANPLKMLKLKADGFQFIQEVAVNAPPKKVWASLMNISKWFSFDPRAKDGPRHTFDAKPGGHWTSTGKDGTMSLHGTVTHIEPQKLLRLSGAIGMTHLPVSNVFIFELQPKNNGKSTLLRFGQRSFGFMTPDVKKSYGGGWKQLLGQLKNLAEG